MQGSPLGFTASSKLFLLSLLVLWHSPAEHPSGARGSLTAKLPPPASPGLEVLSVPLPSGLGARDCPAGKRETPAGSSRRPQRTPPLPPPQGGNNLRGGKTPAARPPGGEALSRLPAWFFSRVPTYRCPGVPVPGKEARGFSWPRTPSGRLGFGRQRLRVEAPGGREAAAGLENPLFVP